MMKDLWLTARYGDLDQAIAMLKADQDAKMPLADPRFGFEEPGPRGIYLIMHAVASEIVPPEALQELARAGIFGGNRFSARTCRCTSPVRSTR